MSQSKATEGQTATLSPWEKAKQRMKNENQYYARRIEEQQQSEARADEIIRARSEQVGKTEPPKTPGTHRLYIPTKATHRDPGYICCILITSFFSSLSITHKIGLDFPLLKESRTCAVCAIGSHLGILMGNICLSRSQSLSHLLAFTLLFPASRPLECKELKESRGLPFSCTTQTKDVPRAFIKAPNHEIEYALYIVG